MIGNTAEAPAMALAATLASTLHSLVQCESELVLREAELVRVILSRFSMIPASDEHRPACDAGMMVFFHPWSALSIQPTDIDGPAHSSSRSPAATSTAVAMYSSSSSNHPHASGPVTCCYGFVQRTIVIIGGVETPCIARIFARDSLVQHLNPYNAATGDTISVEEAEDRLNRLYFCLLSLQLEDVLTNSIVCPKHQLPCLGFSYSAATGTHATLFAMPPRWSVRQQLAALRAKGVTMLLTGLLHLSMLLMDHLVYLQACGGCVHGALDLDNIFSDDDLSVNPRPQMTIGPSAAISVEVAALVPDATVQMLLDPEEFANAAAQTWLDDEQDVHRAILEALHYGTELDDDDNNVDYLLNKIPSGVANLLFGLTHHEVAERSPLAPPSAGASSAVGSISPASSHVSVQRFAYSPQQVRDALADTQLLQWASTTGVPF